MAEARHGDEIWAHDRRSAQIAYYTRPGARAFPCSQTLSALSSPAQSAVVCSLRRPHSLAVTPSARPTPSAVHALTHNTPTQGPTFFSTASSPFSMIPQMIHPSKRSFCTNSPAPSVSLYSMNLSPLPANTFVCRISPSPC